MSYEGYREYKCSNGHIDAANVYDREPIACRTCGERYVRIRSVDQTNGHDVLPWRDVEYRPRFKDYVAKGYYGGSKKRRA